MIRLMNAMTAEQRYEYLVEHRQEQQQTAREREEVGRLSSRAWEDEEEAHKLELTLQESVVHARQEMHALRESLAFQLHQRVKMHRRRHARRRRQRRRSAGGGAGGDGGGYDDADGADDNASDDSGYDSEGGREEGREEEKVEFEGETPEEREEREQEDRQAEAEADR